MVYKKYITCDGKTYGPYFYESYREDGKVKKRYIKMPDDNFFSGVTKNFLSILLIFSLVFVLMFFSFSNFTGDFVLDVKEVYSTGEMLEGGLIIGLNSGEFLPVDSIVSVNFNDSNYEFILRDIVSEESSEGEFYVEGESISGSGEGYGAIGVKEVFPDVSFKVVVKDVKGSNSGGSGSGKNGGETSKEVLGEVVSEPAEEVMEEETEEEIEEESEEEISEPVEEVEEVVEEVEVVKEKKEKPEKKEKEEVAPKGVPPIVEDGGKSVSSPITGEVVSESKNLVSGEVTKENSYSFEIEEGQEVSIVKGDVEVSVDGTTVTITTDYSENEEGFGEEYLGDLALELEIDLDSLEIMAKSGEVDFDLNFNGEIIVSETINIVVMPIGETPLEEVVEEIVNESVDEVIIEITLNETLSNITELNVSVVNETLLNLTIETIQYGAVIGKPVKWKKKVTSFGDEENISVELPAKAENVSVFRVIGEDESEELEVDGVGLSKNEEGEDVVEVSEEQISISGKVVSGKVSMELELEEEEPEFLKFIKNIFSKITGKVVTTEEVEGVLEVVITDNSSEFEIEYETEAPQSYENLVSENKKEIIISGPEELHYQNILAYSELPKSISLEKANKIKLIWLNNGTREASSFSVVDLDNDSVIDYIEWVVPHLSNQSYEIILINNAEHLDGNRTYISDVYDLVSVRDNNFTTIPAGDYLRVGFESELDKTRDITIYAKSESNFTNASVIVYEKDKNESLIVFDVSSYREYKKYLTLLNGTQDVFDLLVVGGGVEFDFVIDPVEINQSLETGLVLLMHMNNDSSFGEDDTVVYDFSGNGNNGTVSGGTFVTDGKIDGGIAFTADGSDGIDGTFSKDMNPNTNFTLSLWFKKANVYESSNKELFNRMGTNHLFYLTVWGANENILFIPFNESNDIQSDRPYTPTNSVNDTNWHNVVVGYNGSTLLYLDGVLASTGAVNGNINNGSGAFTVGKNWVSYSEFNGTIDEVAIWNRSLSDSEVLRVYRKGLNNTNAGCVNITSPGTYYLGGDISNHPTTCIIINSSDVVFDGQGYTIDGVTSGDGIGAYGTSGSELTNVTVKNCVVNDFTDGVGFKYVDNSFIINSSVTSTNDDGFGLLYSQFNNLINITSSENNGNGDTGIYFISSDNNNVTGGTIFNNHDGISFANAGADNNIIRNLNITNNSGSGVHIALVSTDNNLLYNNFFNNSINVQNDNLGSNYFNTTKTAGTNIIGGSWIGGNFWTSPTVNNWSDVCNDYNSDGICDDAYNVSSLSECIDCTGYEMDEIALTYVDLSSNISIVFPTPANDSTIKGDSLYINTSSSDDKGEHSVFVDLDNSLVGWWNFDERNSSGGVTDISSNSNNGTIVGEASYTSYGKRGGGFKFDGDGDRIFIPNAPSLGDGNISASAWVNTNVDDVVQTIVAQFDLFDIKIRASGGDLTLYLVNSTEDATILVDICPGAINVGQWHHVAFTTNTTNATAYVDGVLCGVMPFYGPVDVDSNDIYIGNDVFNAQDFNGTIDEVMIFNRSLSSAEIQSIYNASEYRYEVNHTGLSDGSHSYKVYVTDSSAHVNFSERTVTVDNTVPAISLVSPSSSDNSIADRDWIYVNTSSSDTSDHSVFIDLNRSLVLWMPFDSRNLTGGVTDLSSWSNNGTVVGATYTSGGKRGGAFEFDGSGDYVSLGNDDSLHNKDNSSFFIMAWIKPNTFNTDDAIITRGISSSCTYRDKTFYLGGYAGDLGFSIGNGIASSLLRSTSNLQTNEWTFVTAGVNSSGGMSLYINGVLNSTRDAVPNYYGADNTTIIGACRTNNNYFDGTIDELMIFNHALTPEEVSAAYNAGIYRLEANITGLSDGDYPFTVHAIDSSGNMNSTVERTTSLGTNVNGCRDIIGAGNYVLTNSTIVDYPDTCIQITSSNVEFDGAGLTIDGLNSGYGIHVAGVSANHLDNITIKNSIVNDFAYSIMLDYMDDSLLDNVSINSSSNVGLYPFGSSRNKFNNLTITNPSSYGLFVGSSHDNNITSGIVADSDIGLFLHVSSGNIIKNFNITGHATQGIKFNTANSDNNLFYNNFFNNTLNVDNDIGASSYFNTTKTAGTNIIGGSWTYGNFWTNPTADNFSGTCTDADRNRICDDNMNVTTGESTTNTGYGVDEGVLLYGSSIPANDYGVGTLADYSNMSQDSIYVNLTNGEADISNIEYYLVNDSGVVNNTNYSSVVLEMNWTSLGEGNYTYYVNVTDIEGNKNSTAIRNILLDTTSPIVSNLSGMVVDNEAGGAGILFNWTATDNLDINLTCYPTYSGSIEDATNQVYLANNSETSTNRTLAGGQHSVNITCYDDANNSGQSIGISYLVAVINITSPTNDSIVRINSTTVFAVDEIDGTEFLDNMSMRVRNSSSFVGNISYFDASGDSHSFSYLLDLFYKPSYLVAYVSGFNTSMGAETNVTNELNLTLLRPVGTTDAPILTSACSNITYVINDSIIELNMIADLDTLYRTENLTVTDPDGDTYKLVYNLSSIDEPGFGNSFNYSFVVNKTGTYNISAIIQDYEYQNASWNYSFYSEVGFKNIFINSSRNMTLRDVCSRGLLEEGTSLTLVIANSSLFDLDTSVDSVTRNISIKFKDINLTSNFSEILNYTARANETSPPDGKRVIEMFDLESDLNFTNYTLKYYYGPIAYTIDNPSTFGIYKCSNISSCVLEEATSSVNTTAKTVEAVFTDFSRFMIVVDGTTSTVETITTTTGGGGGGTTRVPVYVNFQVITPGKASMELADKIILPITLTNPADSVDLNDLVLSAISNTQDLSPVFDRNEIGTLKKGESDTVNLIIESHSFPGEYEIDLTVNVSNPLVSETAKIFIRLVDNLSTTFVKERIVMVEDLFKQNPECLEFNDYIIEAKDIVGDNPEKAKEFIDYSIRACEDLVTSKSLGESVVDLFARNNKWERPVMVTSILMVVAFLIVIAMIRFKKRYGVSSREKTKKSFFSRFFKKSGKSVKKVSEEKDA